MAIRKFGDQQGLTDEPGIIAIGDTADTDLEMRDGSSATWVKFDSGNERVGIGTSSPESKLTVDAGHGSIPSMNAWDLFTVARNGACAMHLLGSATGNVALGFGDTVKDRGRIRYQNNDDSMDFRAGGVEVFDITSSAITMNSGNRDIDFIIKDDSGNDIFKTEGDSTPTVAFFGNTGVTRYTNADTFTDNTGGVASGGGTLQDIAGLTIGASYSQSEVQALRDAVANNQATLAAFTDVIINRMNALFGGG